MYVNVYERPGSLLASPFTSGEGYPTRSEADRLAVNNSRLRRVGVLRVVLH